MAGFVKFDPYKWEPSEGEGAAKPAKPAKVGPALATLATLATVPVDLADGLELPADVADGLERLRHMAAPKVINPDHWPISEAA